MAARGGQPHLSYREAMRRFTRNARLYLVYESLSEINGTIYTVAFALYLAAVFVPEGQVTLLGNTMNPLVYIGIVIGAGGLAHGFNSIPSGFLGDRFGRKKSFITASIIGVVAAALTLVTRDPVALLLLSIVNGIGESFHGVVGGPFLMENSSEAERTHLFTLSSVFDTVSSVFGAIVAAGLILFFAGWTAGIDPAVFGPLGFPPESALPLRLALFLAAPFGVIELVPIFFMKESYAPERVPLRDVFLMRRAENKKTIGVLFSLSALYAAGIGLYFPLLAVYLSDSFDADEVSYSPLIAVNSLAIAGAALAVPLLVHRLGKVRSIAFLRVGSVPILLGMGVVPGLFPAGAAYLVFAALFVMRGAVANMAGPITGQFAMESVRANERATTAGFTHFAFDFLFGIGTLVGGLLLAMGGFWIAFVLAGLLYALHGVLWYVWFGNHPVDVASRTPSTMGGNG